MIEGNFPYIPSCSNIKDFSKDSFSTFGENQKQSRQRPEASGTTKEFSNELEIISMNTCIQ